MKCPVVNFQKIRQRKAWKLIQKLAEIMECQPEDLQILKIQNDHDHPNMAIVWFQFDGMATWARFGYGVTEQLEAVKNEKPRLYCEPWL